MNLTEKQLQQMLQEWGASESRRLGLDQPCAPEEKRDRKIVPFTALAPSICAPSAVTPTARRMAWYSTGISALAACIVTAMTLWVLGPERSASVDYTPRRASVKAEQTRLAGTAAFVKGWRRAGMVVSVSDYSGFRSVDLPDLAFASLDAAAARRVMQAQMRAPRENILSLGNRAATEVAVMSGIQWLRQFNRPNDLIVIHLACHALVGPDGRLPR